MLRRRLITIPAYVMGWALWLAACPVWLPMAAIVDAVRRSGGVALRSALVVTVYLSCEVIGILVSGGLWIRNQVHPLSVERWRDVHFRLEAWWGTMLFSAVVRLFGLRIEVEGDADLGRGPFLLLLRHASTADTLLAAAMVSVPYGVRLRYVLKRELLWDPCLDIVGHRVPNVFLDRFTSDPRLEISRLQELGRDLGPRDGILIYPEGTRFSEAKRRRVIERFQQEDDADMVRYTSSLSSVLPPRPAGTLALLEAAPEADVVVCNHTGFEGASSLGSIWQGSLLKQVIQVQFRRIPRSQIPVEREGRIAWIRSEWQSVGAWVDSHQSREGT